MVPRDLIKEIRRQFRLDWLGIHGISHFERVRENGLRLAEETKARTSVVELFAFLHYARRLNEDHDPLHGHFFDLPPDDLKLLIYACEFHTGGFRDGDITVLTCWDADRLDLGRVDLKPIARKLFTDAAKKPEIIEWAYRRSIAD